MSLRRCHRGFTEGAVVAKTPPNSGKRTIIGGRKAQIEPFSGIRDAARKTLRQNPRSENCATEARLPAESPTTDYRRFARIRPLFSNKGVRQCRKRSNSSRFGSRTCVEGGANAGRAVSTRERKGTQLAAAKRQSPNIRGNGPQKRKLHRLRTARS